MVVNLSLWKLHPGVVLQYIKAGENASNLEINPELAVNMMKMIIPDTEVSEPEAVATVRKILSDLDQLETRNFVNALLADDVQAIADMINNGLTSKEYVLLCAAAFSQMKTAAVMLENGADVNVADDDGWTPLIAACAFSNEQMVGLLCDKGADVNKASNFGATPLIVATGKNTAAVIRILLERGADVNATFHEDYNALKFGETRQDQEIINLLKEFGA